MLTTVDIVTQHDSMSRILAIMSSFVMVSVTVFNIAVDRCSFSRPQPLPYQFVPAQEHELRKIG